MPSRLLRGRASHALVVLLVVIAAAVAVGVPAPDARAVTVTETDVRGDDERDAYVGTGGLLLPGTIDRRTRQEVASCPGCRWRLSTPCEVPGAGTPFDGQPICLSVVRGCPGGRLLRSWFMGAGQPWREVGLVCIPPAGPVTVADVAQAARARVERGIPPLAPGFQPPRGVLTQIPVVFESGQPAGGRTWGLDILGRDVTLSASPVWSWQFGDGAELDTSHPGGRYPDVGVTHVYRRSGAYRVACTATWSASFIVDGLGPFAVAEPVRQTQVRLVEVGEGRALLAPARVRPRG